MTLHDKMMGHLIDPAPDVQNRKEETDKCPNWVVNKKTGGKLSETGGTVEELSTWLERTTTGEEWRKRQRS